MFTLLRRIKPYNPRIHCVRSFPLLHTFIPFSSSSSNPPKPESNQDSFAANYLKTKHGLDPEKVLFCSKYLSFDSPERPESVVAFLKNLHFTDAQISDVIRKWPLIFRCVPESNFGPKIEFFHSMGLSSSDIARVLTVSPDLLAASLEAKIIPCFAFLRSLLCSDRDVVFSITRFPSIVRMNVGEVLMPNVEILRGVGVPESHIAYMLRTSPRSMVADPNAFRQTVEDLRKLGFDSCRMVFVTALIVMRQLSSSAWQEKIYIFKEWGWSEDQVLDAFRREPRFMETSKGKIVRILYFFANKTMCGVSVLMKQPKLFILSLEKTIAPRCAFYQVLLSKGLIRPDVSLVQMLVCPRDLFLKRYVDRFADEAADLSRIYQDILNKSKEQCELSSK